MKLTLLAGGALLLAGPVRAQMSVGSYAGNNHDDREITVGFQPQVVIVKANDDKIAHCRTSTMSGDASKALTGGTNLTATSRPTCMDAADANDDGGADMSDAIWIINYQFRGGAAPLPPFPACGKDTTDDELDCLAFPGCL